MSTETPTAGGTEWPRVTESDLGAPPASPPPLGAPRRAVRELGLGLITLGGIVFLFVAYQLFGTNLTEEHNQSILQKSFSQALGAHSGANASPPTGSSGTSPASTGGTTGGTGKAGGTGGTTKGSENPTLGAGAPSVDSGVPVGTAIDHLVIPAIGVDKYVVEGTAEADLSQGPGHYPSTVLPGQVGNAAIAGHRTTYGAPFFRLDEVKKGDPIYVTNTSGVRYTFSVTTSEVVSPSDVAVLDPTPTAELTLTTCNPRFSDTSRLVVVASLTATLTPTRAPVAGSSSPSAKNKAAAKAASALKAGAKAAAADKAAAAGRTSRASLARANLGEGNGSALPLALAYGAAVVLLWIVTRLVVNRTRRAKRILAFIAGVGVCLVPLWFCFENVVRFLPPSV